MGATLSAQRDSKGEDEEPHAGLSEVPEEDSAEERNHTQISSLNGKAENQSDGLSDQCKERILADDGSAFVTPKKDAPQEQDVSQASTDNSAQQMDSTDNTTADDENVLSNELKEPEVGFKKIFTFGGFKFTLRKDKVDKTNAEEPAQNEQYLKAACPSLDSWDTIEGEPVSVTDQHEEEMVKDPLRGDGNAESTETDNKVAIGQISEITEHSEDITPDKEQIEDVPQNSEPNRPMSQIKRFVTQGIFGSLRRKKKVEESLKDSTEEQAKSTDKEVEGLCAIAQEDSTCACLEFSNITLEEDKDLLTQTRDENKSRPEEMRTGFQKEDVVQASPFKRLFRKLSTRRHKEIKLVETDLTGPAENLTENVQSMQELLQKEEESNSVEQNTAEEDGITRPEGPKKRSDSIVSWEALICGGSLKRRARKTSDCEDEAQVKEELTRKATESPTGSSTESDYNNLASSNEQTGSHAETEGSTWKSLKKLMTPKRRGKMDDSSSQEQIPSDTELTKDESFCSIRKLISVHKKKSDMQPENISSEEESKATGTDNEDDETPLVVPMSEYEVVEPEHLQVMTEQTIEITSRKTVHTITDEDKQEQKQPSVNPSYNAAVPIPSDYFEELTEFISKHQQLSDIPEEGIVEESVATPVSFVEWTTQDDTLAEDVADMTADAVTAPEHATEESNGDETTEMVSALSQLTESQKTSGNATPDPSMYDEGKSDLILQEVAETICMTPSVLSIIINEKDSDILRVSDSPYIVESVTKTETKVLVTHAKEEATAICVGLVSPDVGDVRKIFPLPIAEGIPETNEAVQVELVSGELTDEIHTARTATDKVYVAEIKNLKTKFQEAVSHEPNTSTAEAMGKLKQEFPESNQDQVSHMKEYSAANTEDLISVHTIVLHESQLLGKQVISKDINKPERENSLNSVLEMPAHEQSAQSIEVTVVGERGHRHTEVESTSANIQGDVAESAANKAAALVSDNSEASEITVDDVQVTLSEGADLMANNVISSVLGSVLNEEPEITEDAVQVTQADNVEVLSHNALEVAHSTINRVSENTEDVVQVTQAEGTVLVVQNDVALVTDNTFFEESEITKYAVHIIQGEDAEGVAHNDAITLSETRLREVREITEDIIRISQAGGALLVANNVVPPLHESNLNKASKITEDAVHATSQVEDNKVVVTESTLHDAPEIAAHVGQVTLVQDVELVVHSDLVSVPVSILRDASEITEDVVKVIPAEDTVHAANNVVSSGTDSTLNEASEIIDDVAHVMLAEGVEQVAHENELAVTESRLHEASETEEHVIQATPVVDNELIVHSDLVSVPEGILRDTSEIAEDFALVIQAEGVELVAHNKEVVVTESTLHEASETADHVDQVTLVQDVELVVQSDLVSIPDSILRDASEIIKDVVKVIPAEDTVYVANVVSSGTDSTLNEASEITDDVAHDSLADGVELVAHGKEVAVTDNTLHEADNVGQVTLVEDVELIAHSDVVSVPESPSRDASEIVEDFAQVMLAEGVEPVAQNNKVVVTKSTLHEASETADHVTQIALVEDVELVAHCVLVSVPEGIVRDASEMIEDVVKVTHAEDMYVANVVSSGTDSTLNEASEIRDDVAHVTLAEGVELVAHGQEAAVTGCAIHEADYVDQVTLVEDVELLAHNDSVSVPESTLRDASEITDDVAHVTLAEGVELVALDNKVIITESTLHEASEIAGHIDQVTLVELVEWVAHSDVVSVPENTLRVTSEIMENIVKITPAEETVYVANNVASSGTDSTLNEVSEITDDAVQGTLAKDVELVAYSDVVSMSDSTLRESPKFIEHVVRVTQAEGDVFGANSVVVSPTDSALTDASEIKNDVVQDTLAKDTEIVAHNNELAVPIITINRVSDNTEDTNQVIVDENVELQSHNDVVTMPASIVRETSEIRVDVVRVTQAEDIVYVTNKVVSSVTGGTLDEALEITVDAVEVTLAKDVELVAHSHVVSLSEYTSREASEIMLDVKVTQVEGSVLAANNVSSVPDSTSNEASKIMEDAVHATSQVEDNEVVVTESTLHDAPEIAAHVGQVTLVQDVELVVHSDLVSVPVSILRDASEIIEDVVKVIPAEDTAYAANNVISSGTDSTLNEASEIIDDVAHVMLAEGVGQVAHENELAVIESRLHEVSETEEHVIQATPVVDIEMVAHSDLSVPKGILRDTPEIAEDFALVILAEGVELVAHNKEVVVTESTLHEAPETADHVDQVTLVQDVELVVHSDLVSVPDSILRDASEIIEDVVKVIPAEDTVYVANVVSSGTDSTLNEASEIIDDVAHVMLAEGVEQVAHENELAVTESTLHEASETEEHVIQATPVVDNELVVHSDLVSVPEGILRDTPEIAEDFALVILAEGVELVAHNKEVVVTESTLHEALETADHVDQVTLVQDVELVVHSDLVSVPDSILRDASEITEDVVKVIPAEDTVYVANVVSSGTDSTLNEASEIIDDVAHDSLAEGVELVAHKNETVVTENTLHEASEIAKDVAHVTLAEGVELVAHGKEVAVTDNTLHEADNIGQVTLVEDVELIAHSDVVSVPESPLRDASEIAEDFAQVMLAEGVEPVAQNNKVVVTESTIHEASETADHVTQIALVEDIELVAHCVLVSVPEGILRDVSEIIEDVVKVTHAEDMYVANVVSSGTDSTLNEAFEIRDDVAHVTLAEGVELVAHGQAVAVTDCTLQEADKVDQVTLVEDVELLAHNDSVSVPESTLRDASEITDDAVQGTLAKDVEQVAYRDVVSMSDSTLRESPKYIEHVVRVTQAEGDVFGANSVVVSPTDSALTDALEIKNDVVQDALAKDTEIVAHNNELAVPIITINRVSDNTEDTNQVILDENVELLSHNDVVTMPASIVRETSEISVDVVKITQAEDIVSVTNKVVSSVTGGTLDEALEITVDAVEVTLAKDVELVAHSDVASLSEYTLREASDIMLHVKVTQAEGSVLVANNVSSVPFSTSNEASEINDDAVQVRLVEDVEVVAINDVLSVTESTLKEASNVAEDVVKVTLAQYSILSAQNVVALLPDSTLNEASEITEDAELVAHNLISLPLSGIIRSSENTDNVTQAEDTMLVVSVPDSTFNKPSQITEDNVHITEDAVSVGHDAILVSDSTLNEASENIEDVVHVTLAEEAEFAANTNVVSVPDRTLYEITEDVVQVTQTDDVELSSHNVASVPDSSIIMASIKTEALGHVTQAEETVLESHRVGISVPETLNEASEVGEVTQAAVAMSVGQKVIDSMPPNTLNEVSEVTEDTVQSTQPKIVKTVTHKLLSSGTITTTNENAETTDDVQDTLAKVVKIATNTNEASATDSTMNRASEVTSGMAMVFPSDIREAISTVSSVSDSIQVQAGKMEDEIFNSLHFVDSHETHVKVNNTELITCKMNMEPVLYAIAMARETTQQKTESMSEEDSRDTAAERIVHSTALENIPEPDGPTCKEKEVIILEDKCYLPISATSEESRVFEEEDGISKVTLGHGTECTETDTMVVPDQTKRSIGGELFLITLNENKPDEQIQQAPAISEEAKLHEELAEEECQPLTVENPKLKSQEHYTDSKMSVDTYTTDEAPEFKTEAQSKEMTKEIERPFADGEYLRSGTLSEVMKELTETETPEVHSEILEEPQETIQKGSSTNYEPEIDTHELHVEIHPLKSENSKATESRPERCEKGSVQMNETVLAEALTCAEDTNQPKLVSSNDKEPNEIKQIFVEKCIAYSTKGMEYNISEQPVATLQHFDEAPFDLTTTVIEVDQGNIIKDTAEAHGVGKQHLEGHIKPVTEQCEPVLETVIIGVTPMTCEVLSEQNADITEGLEPNTESSDINKQEIESEFYQVKIAEMNTETQCIALKEEPTMDNYERQIKSTEQMTETEMVSETLELTQTEVLTQKKNEHKSETQTSVATVLQIESVKENDPDISAENTLQKTSSLISVIRTEDTIPLAPILADCEETLVFTEPNMQTIVGSAHETETLVVTCEETNIEIQRTVGTSVKDNIQVDLSSFSTIINESLLKSVITVEELLLAQEEVIPAIQMPVEVSLLQEPDMVAQHTKETKLSTPDEVINNASDIEKPIVKQFSETPVDTELEVKAALTDLQVTSGKKEVDTAMFTEDITVPIVPFVKLSTSAVSSMIQTPDSSIERTWAVSTALKEAEMPFRSPEEKEGDMDAPVTVNIEIKQLPRIGCEVNLTAATQQYPLEVETTVNSEEEKRCIETASESLNEDPVSMGMSAESLPEVDDVWGHCEDDIKDDKVAATKASVDLPHTSMFQEH